MYILAITSCPVGIAHTYMAAANLKKQQKKEESRSKLKPRVHKVLKIN